MNNVNMSDQDIVQKAIEQLQEKVDFAIMWNQKGPLDGRLNLKGHGKTLTFNVEVKREIRSYTIPQVEKYNSEHDPFLLIAGALYTKQRKVLRERGINYLDAYGNIYIRANQLLILVEQPIKKRGTKEKGNRAFTKTGLKVLFHFLIDKELINQPQRIIADKANVALGNIPKVIEGLKETGYILALNNKEFLWQNRKELLERWVREYETTVIPKIQRGKYTFDGDWRSLSLGDDAEWGGEAAGELLTNYLRAEKLLLYTNLTLTGMIKKYKLIPFDKGNIEVREKFWTNILHNNSVPPILVYADLLLTNNQRCIDTAKLIFNEYIEEKL
jgi:hypothetical protein